MGQTMNTNSPRGIRNANPGNLEWGDPWQGLVPQSRRTDKRFAQFTSPAWGIRALARTLITYYDRHGIRTIRQAINRWAPPVENNTDAYVKAVSREVGVGADQQVSFHDYKILRPMVEAIIRHENGAGPLKTTNSWYDVATIDEGLRLAGVVKPVKNALLTPQGAATGTAVAAGSVAAVTEIVQQVTPVVTHVKTVNDSTEGMPTWVRVVALVFTLVAVGAAGYSLWSKQREVRSVQ